MRYRKLDANGDMVFGHQQADFYIDVPAAPAQAAMTRLLLYYAEWFIDTSDGTRWLQHILGRNTQGSRDLEVKSRVLGSRGVTGISQYSSASDSTSRAFSAQLTIDTVYGQSKAQLSGGGGQTPSFVIGPPLDTNFSFLTNDAGSFITEDTGRAIPIV